MKRLGQFETNFDMVSRWVRLNNFVQNRNIKIRKTKQIWPGPYPRRGNFVFEFFLTVFLIYN